MNKSPWAALLLFAVFGVIFVAVWHVSTLDPEMKGNKLPGPGPTARDGWALLNTKGGVFAYSMADGTELWRHGPCEDVRVQGADVWVFGQTSVDVWRVGPKAK